MRWPGAYEGDYWRARAKMSYKRWRHGAPWETFYPIPMDWIHSMFKHDQWERVDRFGLGAWRPRLTLGVRYRNIKAEYWWDEDSREPGGESNPNSPKSECSIEEGEGPVRKVTKRPAPLEHPDQMDIT